YASYFRLFEIGRAELFRSLGHCFADYVARGLYLAVVAATCRYRRPARYDDELEIRCGIGALGRARLTIASQIPPRAAASVSGATDVMGDGETDHALWDDEGRPHRLPRELGGLPLPPRGPALRE